MSLTLNALRKLAASGDFCPVDNSKDEPKSDENGCESTGVLETSSDTSADAVDEIRRPAAVTFPPHPDLSPANPAAQADGEPPTESADRVTLHDFGSNTRTSQDVDQFLDTTGELVDEAVEHFQLRLRESESTPGVAMEQNIASTFGQTVFVNSAGSLVTLPSPIEQHDNQNIATEADAGNNSEESEPLPVVIPHDEPDYEEDYNIPATDQLEPVSESDLTDDVRSGSEEPIVVNEPAEEVEEDYNIPATDQLELVSESDLFDDVRSGSEEPIVVNEPTEEVDEDYNIPATEQLNYSLRHRVMRNDGPSSSDIDEEIHDEESVTEERLLGENEIGLDEVVQDDSVGATISESAVSGQTEFNVEEDLEDIGASRDNGDATYMKSRFQKPSESFDVDAPAPFYNPVIPVLELDCDQPEVDLSQGSIVSLVEETPLERRGAEGFERVSIKPPNVESAPFFNADLLSVEMQPETNPETDNGHATSENVESTVAEATDHSADVEPLANSLSYEMPTLENVFDETAEIPIQPEHSQDVVDQIEEENTIPEAVLVDEPCSLEPYSVEAGPIARALAGDVKSNLDSRPPTELERRILERLTNSSYELQFEQIINSIDTTEKNRTLIVSIDPTPLSGVLAAHLAILIASKRSENVLLVDANVNDKELSKKFDRETAPGFSNTLRSDGDLQLYLTQTSVRGLQFLPAGTQHKQANSEQATGKFEHYADSLQSHVFMDGGSMKSPYSAQLCKEAGSVILLIEADNNDYQKVKAVTQSVRKTGANLIGCVMTGVYRAA